MTNVARLDNVEHAALRLRRGHGARFGEAVNQVAVFASEFDQVQREYPILFARTPEGALQAVAILGFDRDENLFLDGERWDAATFPRCCAAGPFTIGAARRRARGLRRPGRPAGGGGRRGRASRCSSRTAATRPRSRRRWRRCASLQAGAAVARGDDRAVRRARAGRAGPAAGRSSTSTPGSISTATWRWCRRRSPRSTAPRSRGSTQAGLLDVAVFAAASLGTMPRLIARKQRKLAAAG